MQVFNGILLTALRKGTVDTDLDLVGKGIGVAGALVLSRLVMTGSLATVTITKGVTLPIGAVLRGELTELNLSNMGLVCVDAVILGILTVATSLLTLDLSGML